MSAFSPPIVGGGHAAVDLALRRMKNSLAVLHITAHPDDEDAHTLTTLARAEGYRVGIYSLTRGESGENAVDHRAFEALGAMRTAELLRAACWYGVEDVYFGPFYDYGYSKRLDEAFDKWGQQGLVRELVRVLRAFRPDIVLGRFRGERSDGHAHHQAAGWAAREAFRLAPDASAFTELGLNPVKPAAYFVLDEPKQERGHSSLWEVIDSKATLTPLGSSCAEIAELGYAEHRSQTGGKRTLARPRRQHYRCLARHHPHLGDDRFGFRTSARIGISNQAARLRYEQAIEVLEERATSDAGAKSLTDALATLVELAPNAIMRSRADDLWNLIESRPPFARAFDVHREEPKSFFQPFPTVKRYTNTFTVDIDARELATVHLNGSAEVVELDGLAVEFAESRAQSSTRRANGAVYDQAWPLFPYQSPACIVEETSRSQRRHAVPVIARAEHPPHDFEIIRRCPSLPQGQDIRIAGAAPRSVVSSVKRTVWYIPGYAECYGSALRQLEVEFSECSEFPSGIGANDTVLVGFRAYRRHSQLADAAKRINESVKSGAHVLVMGQTSEYEPCRDAPYEGVLKNDAPEACEEDRPVELLEQAHPCLNSPHTVRSRDFTGWREQFGSKFWTSWSPRYTALVACADLGEPEQRGVLLTTNHGDGRYTYCALALHLQLIDGHPGAYKLFANLLQ